VRRIEQLLESNSSAARTAVDRGREMVKQCLPFSAFARYPVDGLRKRKTQRVGIGSMYGRVEE